MGAVQQGANALPASPPLAQFMSPSQSAGSGSPVPTGAVFDANAQRKKEIAALLTMLGQMGQQQPQSTVMNRGGAGVMQ
jgi:hypothetical protein